MKKNKHNKDNIIFSIKYFDVKEKTANINPNKPQVLIELKVLTDNKEDLVDHGTEGKKNEDTKEEEYIDDFDTSIYEDNSQNFEIIEKEINFVKTKTIEKQFKQYKTELETILVYLEDKQEGEVSVCTIHMAKILKKESVLQTTIYKLLQEKAQKFQQKRLEQKEQRINEINRINENSNKKSDILLSQTRQDEKAEIVKQYIEEELKRKKFKTALYALYDENYLKKEVEKIKNKIKEKRIKLGKLIKDEKKIELEQDWTENEKIKIKLERNIARYEIELIANQKIIKEIRLNEFGNKILNTKYQISNILYNKQEIENKRHMERMKMKQMEISLYQKKRKKKAMLIRG